MRHADQPTDAVTHATAVRIARRCTAIIEPCLRPEEAIEALREFYAAIREELEAFKRVKGAP